MRRAFRLPFALVAIGLVWFFQERSVRAQDIEVEWPKVQAVLLDNAGHEHPHVYDLSDPKQRQELFESLKSRKVLRLVQEQPVNVLALSKELGIWTLIVFVLLFVILKKVAWKPILEGLRKREETIHGALSDAQKASADAKQLQNEIQRRLDQIGEEIRTLMDDARRKAEALAGDMTTKARQEIQADRDRLRREIDLARDQALQDIWGQTAQLATLVSAKTIRRQLSPEDHRRLVDEALAEMRHTGNGAAKATV